MNKDIKEFVSEISKKCEKNNCLYYCINVIKQYVMNAKKNKNTKIFLKEIDIICYSHYQKYILKCEKYKLLICKKFLPEHINQKKNNIYFNFYLKKIKKI